MENGFGVGMAENGSRNGVGMAGNGVGDGGRWRSGMVEDGGWGWRRMEVGVGRVQSHQPEAEAGLSSGGPRGGDSEVEVDLTLTECQRMEVGMEENGGWR